MKTPPSIPTISTSSDDALPPLAQRFGRLARRLRSEAGWSQEEFAFRVGVHRTYVGAIERGEKTVTIETAAKIGRALGMTLAQLFVALENLDKAVSDETTEIPALHISEVEPKYANHRGQNDK